MAEDNVVEFRRGRFVPPPDATVHCYNTVYERAPDGTWKGWLEPLGSRERHHAPELLVRGPTAEGVRRELGTRIAQRIHEVVEAGGDEAAAAFERSYSVPVTKRDIPPVEWPPPAGFHRTLAFLDR